MRVYLCAAFAAAVFTFSCAAVKPYAATVNDAAAILCQTAPGVKMEAKARGVSVDELCAMHEFAKPFLDEALRAQRSGSKRAVER